jgi:hypothetical protein
MKKVLTIILVIIAIGAIYYVTSHNRAVAPTIDTSKEVQNGAAQGDAVQNGGAQGKININEVCQGVLMYMTFTDGAAAEKFVAECKEGKHPEVIERFKADLNLGAGVEI